MKKYINFIFDFDGVVVNSIELQKEAFIYSCKCMHIDFNEKLFQKFLMYSGKEIYEIFILLQLPRECGNYYEEYSLKNASKVKIFDGVIEVLQYIKDHNCHSYLFTGKRAKKTYDLLTRLSLDNYFEYVLCGDAVTKTKPDPEGINVICEKVSINKNSTIYIGDTINDIMAAKQANVSSGAALWGSENIAQLIEGAADIYMEKVSDIKKLVFIE